MNEKRTSKLSASQVQMGSQLWWSENPMAYDWRGENKTTPLSIPWFDRADSVFVHSSRLFATDQTPFDRIIPFEQLRGKRVLEIGCGMGLHSELMIRAGAEVTSVDLTETAVRATSERFHLKKLKGTVLQADAEALPFPDKSFDFVWSWGVIHHSSRTGRIVRQIARVLKPEGECRVMVYNRSGMEAKVIFVRDYLLRFGWLRHNFDETLHRGIDGFSARFYVKDQLEDLFRTFFKEASVSICGLDSHAIPLPRHPRRLAMKVIPESYLRSAQAKRGNFLFLTAKHPE